MSPLVVVLVVVVLMLVRLLGMMSVMLLVHHRVAHIDSKVEVTDDGDNAIEVEEVPPTPQWL